jgi:hypothetical protein
VGVALQAPLRVTVRGLVAGEVPDDQGLVAGTGQEHVRAGRCQYKSCRMQPRTVSVFRGVQNSITHFSREVAREVTQPEWPSRVPRRTNCSAMIAICGLRRGVDGDVGRKSRTRN